MAAPTAPAPMLARLEDDLPVGAWSYEPKWDGFRCLAEARGGAVILHSRHGRPLERYFPEVAEAVAVLGGEAILDGEILVRGPGGGPDFGALLARMHPAASRVARLRRETPALFVAFDVLAAAGERLEAASFRARRARLEALLRSPPPGMLLTPSTRDLAVARRWLAAAGEAGIDGVVAKPDAAPYQPGRRALVKVKPIRTADCVVAGFRTYAGEPAVASVLLALWDGAVLRHVGVCSQLVERERRRLFAVLAARAVPLERHPWARGFNVDRSPVGRLGGSAGRWDPETMPLDWTPLAPDLVCEVAYDRCDGGRFRHPARLLRWRPDRVATSCTIDQLAPVAATPPSRP
ncbi:ATP-dependent DNA ligase [Anaeromyxobacter oryzisoli]|uniref:ATP-dependent DNA ligase n=1 Tax=Anaeromyxobacter oryzisoli TaxID=2925408 RepID=UPI001F5A8724|nr:ATP-dependent DNA ligase [Anaeromyxobacter sp. SG63]